MKREGFTLIEILIAITILMILIVGVFVPYNLYSNLSRLRLGKDMITQNINLSRNFSAGIINSGTGKNQDIALFLEEGTGSIRIKGLPYDSTGSLLGSTAVSIKDAWLEYPIKVNRISDKDGNRIPLLILYFKAPEGDMQVYSGNTLMTSTGQQIIIGVGNAETGILSKLITLK